MNTENKTVDTVEDTQNDDSVINLPEMSREELEAYALKNAKAFNDQKGLNAKLKAKAEAPAPTFEAASTAAADIDPVQPEPQTASLDEQYVIASLSSSFSLEEIKEAKSFIGTTFGSNLSEVSSNSGFLAHIAAKRELTKSDTMMNDSTLNIETFQSTGQFILDVEAGNIDITADPKAREKYLDIKAKEEADRNFTG